MIKTIFALLLILSVEVFGKVFIQVDSKIETCVDESERWHGLDYSQVKLFPENDTHTFINGTVKAVKDIKAPIHLVITAEYYTRGEWVMRAYNRTYPDFCYAMKNPVEPWYYVTKNWAPCPYPAGTQWDYDMVPVSFPEALLNRIPPEYHGRWRIVIQNIHEEEGKRKRMCVRGYGTVFDD